MSKSLEIIVTIKPVPPLETWDQIRLDPNTKNLQRTAKQIITPLDRHAIELALQLKEKHGGVITALSMAPPAAIQCLRDALALGVDNAFLLSDPLFGGADTLATARVVAKAIQKHGIFDLIVCGQQSLDSSTAQVPPQIATLLNIPYTTSVYHLDLYDSDHIRVKRVRDDGFSELEIQLPALVSVVKEISTPRYTSLNGITQALRKNIPVWNSKDLNLEADRVGLAGSPTHTANLFEPEIKRELKVLQGGVEEKVTSLIQHLKDGGYI